MNSSCDLYDFLIGMRVAFGKKLAGDNSMKLIVATVPTDKWQAVQEAVQGTEAYILYVSAVGDLRDTLVGSYRGSTYTEPRPRTRLEIVVANDLAVADVVETLKEAASAPNSHKPTNGSIFILPL